MTNTYTEPPAPSRHVCHPPPRPPPPHPRPTPGPAPGPVCGPSPADPAGPGPIGLAAGTRTRHGRPHALRAGHGAAPGRPDVAVAARAAGARAQPATTDRPPGRPGAQRTTGRRTALLSRRGGLVRRRGPAGAGQRPLPQHEPGGGALAAARGAL